MPFDIEKLRQLAQPVSESTRIQAETRKENRDWLRKSAQIAFAIRHELRTQQISQQELAERMGVSPQYVGRLLKGTENLTLDTITKLEKALGRSLMQVHVLEPDHIESTVSASVYVFSSVFGKETCESVLKPGKGKKNMVPLYS